jgi:hypothetical protein
MGIQEKFTPARLHVRAPMLATPQTFEPRLGDPPDVPSRRRSRKPEFLPEIPWELFRQMATLPGKSGWVGLAIYRLMIMRKNATVVINCRQLAFQIGVNPKAVYNALTLLAGGGVLTTKRGRGSFAEVTMLVEAQL